MVVVVVVVGDRTTVGSPDPALGPDWSFHECTAGV